MSTETAASVTTQRHQPRELRIGWGPGQRALPLCAGGLIALAALVSWAARLQIHDSGSSGLHAAVWGAVIVLSAAVVLAFRGLVQVSPGEAVVVQVFGSYVGTLRDPGLRWVKPYAARRRVSLKIRSYETPVLKVNDADGNPVEIAVVAVWQIADTAKAVFAVDDVAGFVAIQAEIAARQAASSYPYDDHVTGRPCLRASTGDVAASLNAAISQRVARAGVEILETRITRLGYAPEIAHAMLRRQQAVAVVAARQKIVDGAVGMVESALARLATDGFVEFDEDRKAAMVSNMLVVLCSDHATQPVVNAGTIYQ